MVKLSTFLCSTAFVHFKYPKIIMGKESILCYKKLSALLYVLVKCFSVTILYFVSLKSFLLTTHCMENRERIVDANSWRKMEIHILAIIVQP